MNRLYIDFDGTLVEFKYVGAETYSAPRYIFTLKQHKNVISAIRSIIKKGLFEVFLVGAVLPFDHAITDRDNWMDENLPEVDKAHRIYVPIGANKADYIDAKKGDVFLDDWNGNLKELFVTSSVEPVKLVNEVNDVHKSWKGARVWYNQDFDTIAMTLYGISLANTAA